MDSIIPFPNGSIIADHFKILALRGKGAYGVVYECLDTQSKLKVAVKQSQLQLQVEGIPATVIREISILKELQHQNIVKLKDVVFAVRHLFLVFQLLQVDLGAYLYSQPKPILPPYLIKSIVQQLLNAVYHCHSRRIIHRDLKPGNILLNQQWQIKLADFGLARGFSYPIKQLSEEVVTLEYRAPQILLGWTNYGTPVDIWSVGCILAQLVFGEVLFPSTGAINQLDSIFKMLGSPTKESWPQYFVNIQMQEQKTYSDQEFQSRLDKSQLSMSGQDLLKRMLTLNPKDRISASDALKHVYFNS